MTSVEKLRLGGCIIASSFLRVKLRQSHANMR